MRGKCWLLAEAEVIIDSGRRSSILDIGYKEHFASKWTRRVVEGEERTV